MFFITFWKWLDCFEFFSKPIKIRQLSSNEKNYHSIRKSIFEAIGRFPDGIYYYLWGPGSYIPWHSDEVYSSAFSIYMNENWNYEDGGLFQYYSNNKVETTDYKNLKKEYLETEKN